MDCGMSIVKYLLFAFNLLCSLAGLGLIIIGALVKIKMNTVVDAVDKGSFDVPAIVIIVIGSIVFVLSFLGCCGAAKEDHCMLISYAVLLCCIFVVQVAMAVLAFVYRDTFTKTAQSGMSDLFDDYNISPDNKAIVNDIQQLFHCCGLNGPSYWKSPSLPQSCCDKDVKLCTLVTPGHYTDGCLAATTDLGAWAGNVIGGVAIGICVIEIVGIMFACCLANSIKNESRRRYA